jgi:hypothetical protein
MRLKVERFPIEPPTRYFQKTGRLLVHRLSQLFTQMGFSTEVCLGQDNGVDLKVFDSNNKLVLVAEVFNWSPHSSLNLKRKGCVIKNLTDYKCLRVLFYTSMDYEPLVNDLTLLYGIQTVKLDYQVLPEEFFEFFRAKNQIDGRRIDADNIRQYIKAKVIASLGFLDNADDNPQPTD